MLIILMRKNLTVINSKNSSIYLAGMVLDAIPANLFFVACGKYFYIKNTFI